MEKIVDSLIYNFQDRFKPLRDIQKRAVLVPEEQDAVLAEERYSGIVRAQTDAFHESMRDPLITAIHDEKLEYDAIEGYLHARHAPSRNADMREINPTEQELNDKTETLSKRRDELAKDVDVLENSLKVLGVANVLRLKRANARRMRDRFGIIMQRTVQELNGEPWLEMEEAPPIAKQVMSSRSFGERVESLQELREAISYHAANAAQRLRKQGLFANAVSVFIQNSPFDQAEFYGRNETVALPAPTECSLQITSAALWLLKKLYQPGVYYQKAGVMLSELVPEGGQQTDLFAYSSNSNKSGGLMEAMDHINRKYQRSTIHLASEGVNRTWSMRRSFKSPNYTGDWSEIPVVS